VPASRAPLRVCLDARLADGGGGGVQQLLMGLAGGLARLPGDEEYRYLVRPDLGSAWLEPYLRDPGQTIAVDPGGRAPARATLDRFPAARRLAQAAYRAVRSLGRYRVPPSDGRIEAAGVDVMHFSLPMGFTTSVPSLYQVFDLQHLHFPEYFDRHTFRAREAIYRTLCARAEAVVVMSRWVRQDVLERYGLPAAKLHVVNWAPIVDTYPVPGPDDLADVRARFGLPEAFAFFPAVTWRHKNHLRLLEALRILRDRGLRVDLVCSGQQNEFFPTLERRVDRLGLRGQVRFVGYVTPLQLQGLYRLARLMVFPSKFEGGGMPVFEAFHAGLAIAASTATCIPDQVGDAGLLFDPDDPAAIASALERLWLDEGLRATLADRGRERIARFSWERTARHYRALYRRLGGRPLPPEDEALLAAPPIV